MKPFLKFFIGALLLPVISLAQSSYKEGYLVTVKGDTIKGYISHANLEDIPKEVKFKERGVDEPRTFSIREIKYFSFNGEDSYRRSALRISMDQTDPNKLNSGRDTSFKTDTVFLQILQQGRNFTLYRYSDGFKQRFYAGDATATDVPEELIYRIYYPADAGNYNRNTISENSYRKQLAAIALRSNVLTDKLKLDIERTEYNEPALLKIANKINSLSKDEIAKGHKSHLGTYGIVALGLFLVLAVLNSAIK